MFSHVEFSDDEEQQEWNFNFRHVELERTWCTENFK